MMSSCLYVIKCSYLPTVAMLICRFGVKYTDSLHNIQFESLLVLAFITSYNLHLSSVSHLHCALRLPVFILFIQSCTTYQPSPQFFHLQCSMVLTSASTNLQSCKQYCEFTSTKLGFCDNVKSEIRLRRHTTYPLHGDSL